MYRVLSCLTTEHDWRLVVLAAAVCFLASAVAISLQRAQVATGRARWVWLALDAAAAGFGIWATHFIAMLAFDPGLGTGYDIPAYRYFAVDRDVDHEHRALVGTCECRFGPRPGAWRRRGRRGRCRYALHRHDGARRACPIRVVVAPREPFDRIWSRVRISCAAYSE